MIILRNLSKSFGETQAVISLNLSVGEGEIFGLIGPNGAGKTTIIKMITGLYKPTQGRIEIGGFDIVKEPEKAKRHTGYIPDEPFVYDKLTGREFLHLVGELYGMDEDERIKTIQELLPIFSMRSLIDGHFEEYSRGNKQKLTILAALLHHPRVLVIDEPVVGIDPEGAKKMKELLVNFAKKGGTVFLSTHTLTFAAEVCSRIGVLHKGKLITEGTLSELRRKAKKSQATIEELYFLLSQ